MTKRDRETLRLRPINQKEAFAFVAQHHRHHRPPVGAKFVVACESENGICGVAIAGRPVSRMLDDGFTIEITRTCTDGTPNACTMLDRALVRAAFALGYRKVITYTLAEEGGASMRAGGWKLVAEKAGGGSWSRPSRERRDKHPLQAKIRWEVAR